MNRHEYEDAVYASGLDAPSKQVLAYLAFRKNWKRDGLVFPAVSTIARDTGLSPKTVSRRMVSLRDLGWLVPTGDLRGRGIKVYDLKVGHSDLSVGHSDSLVGQADLAGGSQRPTEQVKEQGMEQDREQVTTTVPDGPVVDSVPNYEVKEESQDEETSLTARMQGRGTDAPSVYKTEDELRERRKRILENTHKEKAS
jgi:hypothetical protein